MSWYPQPNNNEYYQPPGQVEMTEDEFQDQMSELINDPDSVRDAVYEVWDSLLFEQLHTGDAGAFRDNLQEKLVQHFKAIVLDE